ncbi:MAG: glycosyltransferase [Hyphomicrobiaceae bacterium]|nr:glycosyltransferase [Hyphomicrobiaceae bacterium]
MVSKRGISHEAFQAALFEAEDVLAETAHVDLVSVAPGPSYDFRNRLHRRLLFRGLRRLAYANPGLQRVKLERDYDVLIAVCQNVWDLLAINAVENWKERCGVSICWLGEIWTAELARIPHLVRSLQRFDHVFVSSQGTVAPLSEFLGRKCHFMPTATDTVRFAPMPHEPPRSIDVYSIGRRWTGVHDSLKQAASDNRLFYLFDSYRKMAEMEFVDHRQHRDLFASIAKRSRFFMVSPGKMDSHDETRGQVEIGYRYFEGASSGAVMLGQAANCDAFRELFPWPDAVAEVKPDGSDVLDVIAALEADPERLAGIGRRNAVTSLLRHDWVHRWIKIFEVVGLAPSSGMTARRDRLRVLAEAGSASQSARSHQAPASTAVLNAHGVGERRTALERDAFDRRTVRSGGEIGNKTAGQSARLA